jgi:hypothetical protein
MIDLILVIVAGLSQLLSAILGFVGTDKLTRKQLRWRRATFIILGVLGAAAIAWSAYRSNSVQDAIKEGVDKLIARSDGAPPEETKLFLQCGSAALPKVIPPTGEIFIFGPHASKISPDLPSPGMASLGRYFGPPGGAISWTSKPNSLEVAEKCQLFNYGAGPVFDVALTLDVAARKADAVPGSVAKTSGEVIQSGKWTVNIGKIDAGASEPFVFYFYTGLHRHSLKLMQRHHLRRS